MDNLIGERGGNIQLQGNVVIQDGGRRLQAPTALMNQSDERVKFPQGLLVSDTDLVVQGPERRAGIGRPVFVAGWRAMGDTKPRTARHGSRVQPVCRRQTFAARRPADSLCAG
jgi:hypothetical protein